jgi:hypothetical protein
MAINYDNVLKTITYLQSLYDANQTVIAGETAKNAVKPAEPTTAEKDTELASYQNKVIANAGLKAELLGTVSTAPTLDAKKIDAMGVVDEKMSVEIVAAAADLRTRALALTVKAK